uniref:Excitatory amino acid transporter 2 n=1 Tax=Schistocephalus solidus TaxID=70667 RepID=A0A0X3PL13_SCHSO
MHLNRAIILDAKFFSTVKILSPREIYRLDVRSLSECRIRLVDNFWCVLFVYPQSPDLKLYRQDSKASRVNLPDFRDPKGINRMTVIPLLVFRLCLSCFF